MATSAQRKARQARRAALAEERATPVVNKSFPKPTAEDRMRNAARGTKPPGKQKKKYAVGRDQLDASTNWGVPWAKQKAKATKEPMNPNGAYSDGIPALAEFVDPETGRLDGFSISARP